MQEQSTAIILAIGDELLSGKIRDTNTPFLLSEFGRLGVEVQAVHMLPDVAGTIGRYARDASEAADIVITTGGVGPTHDDVTFDGLALAFDVPLVENPELVELIRSWYGTDVGPAHLKMARVPENATLIAEPGVRVPVVRVENIYVLPGAPTFLRSKFESLKSRFQSRPTVVKRIYLDLDEAEVASLLAETQRRVDRIKIGSYPRYEPDRPYALMVTLEAHEEEVAREALERVRSSLPPESILDVDE